jgi:F-type H+-transporting ATPase subunit b
MSTVTKPSKSKDIINAVIGVVLMAAGMYVSVNHLIDTTALEQMGILLDLGKTIAVIGVFLILFPVIRSFFITPLQEAILARTTELENTFSEAERLRAEMTSMRSDYERRIVETESQAREQIQAQIAEAQNLRQTLMAEATATADQMVKRAQQEIENEKQKALTEIRLNVVNLSLAAAEKLVGANMDTDRNRILVDEFITQVEVAN